MSSLNMVGWVWTSLFILCLRLPWHGSSLSELHIAFTSIGQPDHARLSKVAKTRLKHLTPKSKKSSATEWKASQARELRSGLHSGTTAETYVKVNSLGAWVALPNSEKILPHACRVDIRKCFLEILSLDSTSSWPRTAWPSFQTDCKVTFFLCRACNIGISVVSRNWSNVA